MHAIAADVCVAPQLTPEAMAEAARVGFRSVVNNRPDFEDGPDQPTNAAIEAAARAAGLRVPLPAGQPAAYQTPEQMPPRSRACCEELPRPMLMFCRTGARSAACTRWRRHA